MDADLAGVAVFFVGVDAAIGVAGGFAVVVVDVDQIDVAGYIELAGAELAHADDAKLGACALWGLGGSVLQVQRLDAFGAGYVECHFCQFGHHPRHIVQTGALIAIQLDQTL